VHGFDVGRRLDHDGAETDLRAALGALGYDRREVDRHIARPGWRMPHGYVAG
jgi:hypothetical protein